MTRLRSLTAALVAGGALLASADARAENIDPKCQGVAKPANYDDQVQYDFLANYFALSLTMSPLHGPVAERAGHGSIGLDLLGIPPLGCAQRFVMGHSKTENTNFTPAAPRLRATFAFPDVGKTHLYAGLGYVPPVPVFGTRNVIAGGEIGAGWSLSEKTDIGVRAHAQTSKTIGEIATPFVEGGTVYKDYYQASTMGADAMIGFHPSPAIEPYLALGWVDASTFFWVGDDGVVVNNLHPYFGPAASLGIDGLVAKDHVRYGFELYAAPGGHSVPSALTSDPSAANVTFGDTGHIYTGRLRIAWAI